MPIRKTETANFPPAPAAQSESRPGPTAAEPPISPELGVPDTFESDPASIGASSEAPDMVKAREAAERHFVETVGPILQPDALALAQGAPIPASVNDLTPQQQDDIRAAMRTYFAELPLGAYGPTLASGLRGILIDTTGADPGDLSAISINGLGETIPSEVVERLRRKNPEQYAVLLGAAIATGATYGYVRGSEGFSDLGIEPEISISRFGLRTTIELGWDEHFRNVAPRSVSLEKLLGNRDQRRTYGVEVGFGTGDHAFDVRTVGGFFSFRKGSVTVEPSVEFGLEPPSAGVGITIRPTRDSTDSKASPPDETGAGVSGRHRDHAEESAELAVSAELSRSEERISVGFRLKF